MATITTRNGNWKVVGMNLAPSDSIYATLKSHIESGNLEQAALQKATGNNLPIIVDYSSKTITFRNF